MITFARLLFLATILPFATPSAYAQQQYQHHQLRSVGEITQSEQYSYAVLSQTAVTGSTVSSGYSLSAGGLTEILRLMQATADSSDTISVDYSLNGGWNLVGFPMQLRGDEVEVVRSKFTGVKSLWTWEDGRWLSNVSGTPQFLNSLQNISGSKGYYVYMPSDSTVTAQLSGDASSDVIQLEQGWNLIALTKQITDIQSFLDLNGAESIWSYNSQRWLNFIGGEPDIVNTLQAPLELGVGYFVKVRE